MKKTQGRAEAPGDEEITACIYPLAEGFFPSAGVWEHGRKPWCRSRFPFLAAGLSGLQMPLLPEHALVFSLGHFAKEKERDLRLFVPVPALKHSPA